MSIADWLGGQICSFYSQWPEDQWSLHLLQCGRGKGTWIARKWLLVSHPLCDHVQLQKVQGNKSHPWVGNEEKRTFWQIALTNMMLPKLMWPSLPQIWLYHPCDGIADWELRLTATVQNHEGIMSCKSSLGKNQNSKFEVGFYWMCNAFALSSSWKIVNRTIPSRGTIFIYHRKCLVRIRHHVCTE